MNSFFFKDVMQDLNFQIQKEKFEISLDQKKLPRISFLFLLLFSVKNET